MSKIDWRRAQHPGRQRVSVSDEAEHLGKDRAARWLEKQPHTHPTPQRTPVKADPMSYQQSTRITSLFSNTAKSGGIYFSGKLGEAVTIPAGARVTLVKSTKTALQRLGNLGLCSMSLRTPPMASGSMRRAAMSISTSTAAGLRRRRSLTRYPSEWCTP